MTHILWLISNSMYLSEFLKWFRFNGDESDDKNVDKMLTDLVTADKGLYLWLFAYVFTKFAIIYCMQVILSDFHFFGNFPKKCFVIWRLANQKTWFTSLSEIVLLPWLFSETLNPSLNRAMDSELDFYRSYFSTGNCIRIYIGSTAWCGT